jgi:hypothetical protein
LNFLDFVGDFLQQFSWFHLIYLFVTDKIRQYRSDNNNCPSNSIFFMRPIVCTSSRVYSAYVRLLFLQAHRETDLFFTASGVQLSQSNRTQFHYHHTSFSSQIKSKVENIFTKTSSLRVNLNIDDTLIHSRSHTHPSHSQTSRLLTSSLSLGVPVPHSTQCM